MEKPLKLIVEALLFSSTKPLTPQEIQKCLEEPSVAEVRTALSDLTAEYDAMQRSFSIKEVAQGYQIRTRSGYASYVHKMLRSSPARLSRAALETLAIVAYKQPIIRQEIERFRGVDVGGILRTLLEKDLIRILGRKSLPGRPLIYGTTKKFLEVFDLRDLESLPRLKEIKAWGDGDDEPADAAEEDGNVETSEETDESSFRENEPNEPAAGEGPAA